MRKTLHIFVRNGAVFIPLNNLKDIKKTFSILLLTAFLFNLFGYFPLFKMAQHKIQKQIKTLLKKGVPKNELYVISVALNKVNELDWKKEGKEFRHKGAMYDIVKQETKGGFVFYYCVNDKQETQLFAHLEELVNQQINNDKSPAGKTAKNILKLLSSFNYISSNKITFEQENSENAKRFSYSYFCSLVFIEVSTPPPNSFI